MAASWSSVSVNGASAWAITWLVDSIVVTVFLLPSGETQLRHPPPSGP
jgi:hypothetical protein